MGIKNDWEAEEEKQHNQFHDLQMFGTDITSHVEKSL